nr:MAG TPA: hypothetical protein [Caudoviricetes sp.]
MEDTLNNLHPEGNLSWDVGEVMQVELDSTSVPFVNDACAKTETELSRDTRLVVKEQTLVSWYDSTDTKRKDDMLVGEQNNIMLAVLNIFLTLFLRHLRSLLIRQRETTFCVDSRRHILVSFSEQFKVVVCEYGEEEVNTCIISVCTCGHKDTWVFTEDFKVRNFIVCFRSMLVNYLGGMFMYHLGFVFCLCLSSTSWLSLRRFFRWGLLLLFVRSWSWDYVLFYTLILNERCVFFVLLCHI